MKDRLKYALFFCLYYTGIEWLVARLIPVDAVAMLMYHGVCDNAVMPAHVNFHVKRGLFERQMRVLKRRYRVVPLRDVVASLASGERLEKSVVLTFDDGYRNNHTDAAPVMNRLGLPFTIFVSTDYVATERWLPLNEIYWLWSVGKLQLEEMNRLRKQVRGRPLSETAAAREALPRRNGAAVSTAAAESFDMLNWEEIQRMAEDGADFGSHTHSHCNMAAEETAQRHSELWVSKQLLESRLERPVRLFAYPYGHSEHMSEAARHNIIDEGYDCAVSAEYGLVTNDSDRFCMPRLGYDQRMHVFAGEICYQFVKQAVKQIASRRRGPKEESRG